MSVHGQQPVSGGADVVAAGGQVVDPAGPVVVVIRWVRVEQVRHPRQRDLRLPCGVGQWPWLAGEHRAAQRRGSLVGEVADVVVAQRLIPGWWPVGLERSVG